MHLLLLATSNPGKFKEISEGLGEIPGVRLLSLADVGLIGNVEETGQTYEENSLLKARHFHLLTRGLEGFPNGIPTMGEDSGIVVEALVDELGVFTRRWGAGENASDEEWIEYFLKRLEAEGNRRATFTTVATVYDGVADPVVFRGETSGVITPTLETALQPGIPISACFRPDGCERVYSALSTEEKNRLSHRGKAMRQLRAWLTSGVIASGAKQSAQR